MASRASWPLSHLHHWHILRVVLELAERSTIVDWLTIGLAVASALLLLRFRINSAWLVLGGALAGITGQFIPGIQKFFWRRNAQPRQLSAASGG